MATKNTKTITDPVCGMTVEPTMTESYTKVGGKTYFFCGEGCRKSFVNNSEKYICPEPFKKKGIWGRYLARLEKASGGKPMKCH